LSEIVRSKDFSQAYLDLDSRKEFVKRLLRSTLPKHGLTFFKLYKVYNLVFNYIRLNYPHIFEGIGLGINFYFFGGIPSVKDKHKVIPIFSLLNDPKYFILINRRKGRKKETLVVPKSSLEDYLADEFVEEVRLKVSEYSKYSTKELLIQNIKEFGLKTMCEPLIREAARKIEECINLSRTPNSSIEMLNKLKTARELLDYVDSKLYFAEKEKVIENHEEYLKLKIERESIMACINIIYGHLGMPSFIGRYMSRLKRLCSGKNNLHFELLNKLKDGEQFKINKNNKNDPIIHAMDATFKIIKNLSFKAHENICCNYDETFFLFEEFTKYTTEKKDILNELKPIVKKDFEVLDIGAGTGALTIPLAKLTKKVVALDPSDRALNFLKTKALQEGITNIQFRRETWEEAKDLGTFDMVLCSHTLYFIQNWVRSINKMLDVTKKYLVLVVHSNDCEFARFLSNFWPKIKGNTYCNFHDYIYVHQLLQEIGISPQIKIIKSKICIPNIKKALELSKFFFETTCIPSHMRDELEAYFMKKITNGKVIIENENAIIIVKKSTSRKTL